ncbi:MAG: hypothetical protein ABI690_29585 [Chloroflexota bacterium]
MMLYVILEKTPVPGRWEKMATYRLQYAERDLHLGRHYGDRATKLKDTLRNDVLLYSWDDAQRIVAYWQERRDWAQYHVLGHVS